MECLHRHNFFVISLFALIPHYWPRKLKIGKLKKHLKIMCTINKDHMMYDIWCMFLRYEVQQTEFVCHIGQFFAFLHPLPLTTWKMKISKMKKTTGDMIILHKCIKNLDRPLYCSRDMAHDGCNCYFHFGLYFSLLPP